MKEEECTLRCRAVSMTQVSPTRGGQRLLLPEIDKIGKRFKRPLLSFRQVAADMGTTRPCGTCQIHIIPSDVAYCVLFLAVLVVFMFSFLRGGFSAAGGEDEKPSLPISQAARTPPKRRLQVLLHFEVFYLLQVDQVATEASVLSNPASDATFRWSSKLLATWQWRRWSSSSKLPNSRPCFTGLSFFNLCSLFFLLVVLPRHSFNTGHSIRSTRWSRRASTTLNTGCNSGTWRGGV